MKHRINSVVLAFSAALLLAIGSGCASSDKQIIQQASQFNDGIKPAEIQHPQTNAYMQSIGDRIVAAAKRLDAEHVGPKQHFSDKDHAWMFQDIHWELVNSKTVNAFTTGGHYVYIYDALFQMCRNEDELAAVMSHEYGHIYCRHVQQGAPRQEALAGLSLVAGGAAKFAGGSSGGTSPYAQYAATLAQTGGTLLANGFSRKDEAQADEYGLKFYTRAGWPPEHFGDFFKEMIAAGYDKTPAIASDHPTLASRVQAANAAVAKMNPQQVAQWRRPNIASQQQFDQNKQQALAASQGMPSDQQALQAKNLLQALPRSCWLPYEPTDELEAQQKIVDTARSKAAASGGK